MTGPLYMYGMLGPAASLVVAVLIGFCFGFVLERAGFGDARNLTNIFYFRDMRVLRVMFSAIVTAMLGLVLLSYLGLFDYEMVLEYALLPTYFWPQLVGGLIFGMGFVVGGYCPGTSVVAVTSGKLDAVVFIVGLVAGVGVFAGGFDIWGSFYKSSALGRLTLWQVFDLPMVAVAAAVLVMALGAFYLAGLAEKWAPYGK
ncbi:YeeE/YedE thiosulfate transporter family protein [Thermodesulfobacteriota bacterium]